MVPTRISVASACWMRVTKPFLSLCFTCFSPSEVERHLETLAKTSGGSVSFSAPGGSLEHCCHLHGPGHGVKNGLSNCPRLSAQRVQKKRLPRHFVLVVSTSRTPTRWLRAKLGLLKSIKLRFPPIERESTFMLRGCKSIGKANVFSALFV